MADVTGATSSLPGKRHSLPEGTMCDCHPEVPAVARIQGETDSFGAELNDLCQQCLDEMHAYKASSEARVGQCDWCRSPATDLRDARDYEEGMCGPVYRVCGACIRKANEEAEHELAAYDTGYWDDENG